MTRHRSRELRKPPDGSHDVPVAWSCFIWSRSEIDCVLLEKLELIPTFGHANQSIEWNFFKDLRRAASRPVNFEGNDAICVAETDFRLKAIASEAAVRADECIHVALAVLSFGNPQFDSGAYPKSIRIDAAKTDCDPVMLMTGILEEHVPEGVVRIGAAHLDVKILIAILIDIAEGDAVPLLKVTETSRLRHILKA